MELPFSTMKTIMALDDSESNYVGVTDADGNFQLPDFSAAAQGDLLLFYPEHR